MFVFVFVDDDGVVIDDNVAVEYSILENLLLMSGNGLLRSRPDAGYIFPESEAPARARASRQM